MSRSLGPALPRAARALSQADLPSRLGAACRSSPSTPRAAAPDALLLPRVLAVDAGTLRVVIGAGSRSARNLEARGVGTLLIVEPERTVYVKCRATGAPLRGRSRALHARGRGRAGGHHGGWEGGVRITGGITYAPSPSLEEPWVKGLLAALRAG